MSLEAAEIESLIAAKLGEIKEGIPFSVDKVEQHIAEVLQIDQNARNAIQEAQAASLQNRKNGMICKNPKCGNRDELYFEKDERQAQVTCKLCGTVLLESQVHDGEWVRQFEGEVNPSFHGPPPDQRFSSSHSLRTGNAEVPGTKKKMAKDISMIQKQIEMNFSNLNSTERLTRIGYKDEMKEKIFELIQEVGDALQLHKNVLERAKTLFARIRDAKESLYSRYEVTAACMIAAFREARQKDAVQSAYSQNAGPRKVNEFKCKYCGFTFSAKKDLRLHECDMKPAKKPASTSSNTLSVPANGDNSKRIKLEN